MHVHQSSQIKALRLCIVTLTLFCTIVATASPVQASSFVHVVQPGESLSVIAVRYGISLNALISANGIGNTNYVYSGQQLIIPTGSGGSASSSTGGGSYVTVGRGDSLSVIAAMHGMSTRELMQLNGLSNPDHVYIGQRLLVSGSGSSGYSDAASTTTYQTATTNSSTHLVQRGETLSQIAQRYGITTQQLMNANGLTNANHVWVGQQLVLVGESANAIDTSYAPPAGKKRIEVNLSNQTLTAWQGQTAVLYTSISSGLADTPTVTGRYSIGRKYSLQNMVGPGYSVPNVPWVMYFWDGYALHGAYWHNNFGTPMSHGCVHLRPSEAEYLYNWADAGTEIVVY